MNSLLSNCGALTTTNKRSEIPYLNASLELFVARKLEAGESIGKYYETLVYSKLVHEKQKRKAYGEGVMSGTV